jgi:hypothetical protein
VKKMTDAGFRVRVVGPQVWDPATDNVDVEVTLADGRRFGATFFTLENISRLFDKNRETGECNGGAYFWSADMIIVQALTSDVIHETVRSLLADGEFHSAFSQLGQAPKAGGE